MENSSQTQLSDQDASNSTHKLEVTVWCAVFVAETVAIVIGNLLTVIIFARDASVRKPSSYLIMSLALADLLIGLFTLPLWIYQSGLGTVWHSTIPQHGSISMAFIGLDIFTNLASISNLAAISVERLYATLLPWRHRATTRWQFWLLIAVVWMTSALSAAIYIVTRLVVLSALGIMCSFLPHFCLLLLVICASYTAILVKMRRSSHRRLDRERKLTITLFIATAFSLVAYLPMIVLGVLYFALGKEMNNLFMNLLSFFNFGNSLVNPILYSFRMPDFRRAVRSIFCPQKRRQQMCHSHVTIPPADDCVAPFSFRMTAVSPTMSPRSGVSTPGSPIPLFCTIKGPGNQREMASGQARTQSYRPDRPRLSSIVSPCDAS